MLRLSRIYSSNYVHSSQCCQQKEVFPMCVCVWGGRLVSIPICDLQRK